MIRKILQNRQRYYIPIIIIQIFAIAFLYGLQPKKDLSQNGYTSGGTEQQSVYDNLPYEGEDFLLYYNEDSKKFTLKLQDYPFDEKIQKALEILYKYNETKDITEGDLTIVYPGYSQ